MVGIDPCTAQHHLRTREGFHLVKQKLGRIHPERRSIIKSEVKKLLEVGFIREVQYLEWLANIVVVPKKNGKWCIYVDYSYLNEACPKDSFPPPRIDQIVPWQGMSFSFSWTLTLGTIRSHVPAKLDENGFHHNGGYVLPQGYAV